MPHRRPKLPELPASPGHKPQPSTSIPTVDEGGWMTRLDINDNPWLPGARSDALARAYDRVQRGNDAIFRVHASREDADALMAHPQRDGLEAWWDKTLELVRCACPAAKLDTLCAEAQAAGHRVNIAWRPK